MLKRNTKMLQLLRCIICDYYVTAPIFQNQYELLVCSDCASYDRTLVPAAKVVTELASSMIFPCMYESAGCHSTFEWEQINDHEMECDYRHHLCPVNSCKAQLSFPKVEDHFLVEHEELCQQTNTGNIAIDLNIFEIRHTIVCIRAFNHKFLLRIKRTEEYDYTAVVLHHVGPKNEADKFSYEIKLKHSRQNLVFQGQVEFFQTGFCNMKNAVIIMDSYLRDQEENEACLTIIKKINRDPDDIVLKTVQCPVCSEYMTAPIMFCSLGHSLCYDCRKVLDRCNVCGQRFRRSRNCALENMIATYRIACANNKNGCLEMGSVGEIKKHELNCRYEDYYCTSCDYTCTIKDLLQHAKRAHYEFIEETAFLIWQPDNISSERIIIESRGKPYILCIEVDGNDVHFAVKAYADADKYMYTIELIKTKIKHTITHFCTSYKLPMRDLMIEGDTMMLTKEKVMSFNSNMNDANHNYTKAKILMRVIIDKA